MANYLINNCHMAGDIVSDNIIDIGHVYQSFRNSRSRSVIYFHLEDIKPRQVTAHEISGATGLDIKDVIGAMEGSGNKYTKEDSLVGMNLATRDEEKVHGQTFILYGDAPLSFDLQEALKEYAKQVNTTNRLQDEIEKIFGNDKKTTK